MHVRKEGHRGNADFRCACTVFVVPLGYLSSCSETRPDSQERLLRGEVYLNSQTGCPDQQ